LEENGKMSFYNRLAELWENPKKNLGEAYRQRLIQWRKEPSALKIDYPTRLDRARNLGYKAKKGFVVVRVKLLSGGRMKTKPMGGRRSKRAGRRKVLSMNYKWVAEQRAQKHFWNLEVLNSYEVAFDGHHYWFEVIMVNPEMPEIKYDPKINWICNKRKRALRGLTSAARKSRGLRYKGKGAEKARPSKNANRL